MYNWNKLLLGIYLYVAIALIDDNLFLWHVILII